MVYNKHVYVVKSTEDEVIRVFKDTDTIVKYYNLDNARCSNCQTDGIRENEEYNVIHGISNYIRSWTCCISAMLTIRYTAKMCYTLCCDSLAEGEKLEILRTSII